MDWRTLGEGAGCVVKTSGKNSGRYKNLLPGGVRGHKGGGGRPKLEVTELAKRLTEEAINRLAYWMRSNDATASVKAATVLLERAHGKPMQAIEHTGKDGGPLNVNVIKFSDEKWTKEQ